MCKSLLRITRGRARTIRWHHFHVVLWCVLVPRVQRNGGTTHRHMKIAHLIPVELVVCGVRDVVGEVTAYTRSTSMDLPKIVAMLLMVTGENTTPSRSRQCTQRSNTSSSIKIQFRLPKQAHPHLDVCGIRTPDVTRHPVQRSANSIRRTDPVSVLYEFLGVHRASICFCYAVEFLAGLEDRCS